jgi:hypothetical protein
MKETGVRDLKACFARRALVVVSMFTKCDIAKATLFGCHDTGGHGGINDECITNERNATHKSVYF